MNLATRWNRTLSRTNLPNRHRNMARKLVAAVESLEGRQLLSQMTIPAMAPAALIGRHTGSGFAPIEIRAARAPSGMVTKKPHFYELYTGPKRAGLDVVKASAELFGAGKGNPPVLVLTGTMAGRIDLTQTSVFLFGINRGGGTAPGPFPNRPNIIFDSVVDVTAGPMGVTGSVIDLATHMGTDLPSSMVSVQGKRIMVIVSTDLLPSTGFALTKYRFNLWPRTGLGSPSTIASFIPEFGTAQVGNHLKMRIA